MLRCYFFVFIAMACILYNGAAAEDRALPDRFAKCSGFDAPKDTAGVFFSTDCSTAFVLPRRTGSLKTMSVLPSPFQDACGIRNAQIRAAENKVEQLLHEQEDDVAEQNDRAHCPLIQPRATRLLDQIDRAKLENDAQLRRVSYLDEQRTLCLEGRLECAGVYSDLDFAIRRQLSLEHRLNSTRRRLEALQDRYIECFNDPVEARSLRPIQGERILQQITLIGEELYLSQSFLEGKEGDTINVLLSLEHWSLVMDAQRRNPNYFVLAAPIELALNIDVANDSTIGVSAVQSSSVPLMPATRSFFGNPNEGPPLTSAAFVFGPTASGQVILSLDGTCSIRRQGLDERFLAGYINANVVYRMPLMISLEISAQADFAELYSRIARQTTKGGFFRTSSSSSVINSLRSNEVIQVQVNDDGLLSIDELLEIETTVKDRIIQRGIDQIAREYLPNAPFVDVTPPSKTGADVASKGLRENCSEKWCQVTAVLIDVGSAIFGGTEAIQEFVRRRNVNVDEMIGINTVYYSYGSIALVVE